VEVVEPEQCKAQAKSGVKPIAKAHASAPISAKAEWNRLINEKVSSGMDRMKACRTVNKENPELRERMLEEVNS
jgi:hypothetical protein